MKFKDLLAGFRKLDEDTEYNLNHIGSYITPAEKERVELLLRGKQAKCKDEDFPVEQCLPESSYPILKPAEVDDETKQFIDNVNEKVRQGVWQEQLKEFSKHAKNFIEHNLAPEITNLGNIKEVLALQLTADRFHVLLQGEAAEQLARAAASLSPKAMLGGAGDVLPDKDKSILAKTDQGLCCLLLDSLKPGARTALYEAMEHGFVSHDWGIQHERLPAATSVLVATKKAKAFDRTFLSRFHLVLDTKGVKREKAKPLSTKDVQFVQRYLAAAKQLQPKVSDELEEGLKTPLAEKLTIAAAKLELREEVLRRDVEEAASVLGE